MAQLRQAGVRAVGRDMLLAEPDRSSPSVLTGQLFHDLKVPATGTGLPEARRGVRADRFWPRLAWAPIFPKTTANGSPATKARAAS